MKTRTVRSLSSRISEDHPRWSPLWFHVEFVFYPLPWNWGLCFYRSSRRYRDFTLQIGPFALVVMEG